MRMKQFPDQTSWQIHISRYIPEYVESLVNKDSISYLHLLCPVVLPSQSDLWHHFRNIYTTHQLNVEKKYQYLPDKNQSNRFKSFNAAGKK